MKPDQVSDLLARLIAHEEQALVLLYQHFGGLVYSIALRILHEPAQAEEVTQDVFMRLWDKAASFDAEQASFTTWLGRITRNMAIDAFRKMQTRQPPQGTFSIDNQPTLWEQTLAHRYEEDSTRYVALSAALQSLPSEQAELIYLAYFGGMSHNDLAETTGIPLGTIKSRIRKGMNQLREAWLGQTPESVAEPEHPNEDDTRK